MLGFFCGGAPGDLASLGSDLFEDAAAASLGAGLDSDGWASPESPLFLPRPRPPERLELLDPEEAFLPSELDLASDFAPEPGDADCPESA